MAFNLDSKIGIIGSGAMGTGIAQVAASAGHKVMLIDIDPKALAISESKLKSIIEKLVAKSKISIDKGNSILNNISFSTNLSELNDAHLTIEAIVEDLEIKKKVFANLSEYVSRDSVIATNTSSLSIASLSSSVSNHERFIGIHFFNPAPLMPLVEIVPSFVTDDTITRTVRELISSWNKIAVIAKDTPGFIVNRIARPFYSESLRILEESIANPIDIDWALKEIGNFKMGPFELMDYIGHDINYEVTAGIWEQFYFDQRFKPSIVQKRLVEAGMLGRKTGRGFYDYSNDATKPEVKIDIGQAQLIFDRVIAMLINEAADAVFMNVADRDDIELAMTKGVNYPKGLLHWADEIGIDKVVNKLNSLYDFYKEDRYRVNPLLQRMIVKGEKFYG